MNAGWDLVITSAEERRKQPQSVGIFRQDRSSDLGTMSFNQDAQGKNVEQVGSMVGSLGGNVSIDAGGTYTQTASNVTAAAGFAGLSGVNTGNITIQAGEVVIDADMNTASSQQSMSQRKTAIGTDINIPILNAAMALRDVAKRHCKSTITGNRLQGQSYPGHQPQRQHHVAIVPDLGRQHRIRAAAAPASASRSTSAPTRTDLPWTWRPTGRRARPMALTSSTATRTSRVARASR